jgi:hypothetical protein
LSLSLYYEITVVREKVKVATQVWYEEERKILVSSSFTHWQNMILLVTEISAFL